jgi:hypothetical protein
VPCDIAFSEKKKNIMFNVMLGMNVATELNATVFARTSRGTGYGNCEINEQSLP